MAMPIETKRCPTESREICSKTQNIFCPWQTFSWIALTSNLISIYIFLTLKGLKHTVTELINGCWLVVSSKDCLNHEPLSVSVRIFHLPVFIKFLLFHALSARLFLLSSQYSSPFYLSPLAVQFFKQKDSKDYPLQLKSDVNAIIRQEPGCFAAKDPFRVIEGDITIGY